jgi:hypothetical protein
VTEPFWKTDKVVPHQYFQAYARIAGELGPSARVCELGVLGGESLWMFRGLFPLGSVTGVDANPEATWPPGTVKIVALHDDPALPGTLGGQFDLIVDDGGHDGAVVRRSFALLWPLVRPGGYYVVEDWSVSLRASERPGETWGKSWGPGMLRAVESFLALLRYPDSECESVEYRYGLAIVRKRRGEREGQDG